MAIDRRPLFLGFWAALVYRSTGTERQAQAHAEAQRDRRAHTDRERHSETYRDMCTDHYTSGVMKLKIGEDAETKTESQNAPNPHVNNRFP